MLGKKSIRILAIVILAFLVFYHFRGGLKTLGPIKTSGDSTCVRGTLQALSYLKNKAPKYHKFVERYIGEISCTKSGSGINVFERPPHFKVGDATREAGTEWYAGSIVHDACHVWLFEQYRITHPFGVPPAHIWSGKSAEQKCIDVQTAMLKETEAPEWIFRSLEHAKNSEYWDKQNWWW